MAVPCCTSNLLFNMNKKNKYNFYLSQGCYFDNCYITNDMNYFGKEATDKFDAIVFGVPIRMKDEVLIFQFIFLPN